MGWVKPTRNGASTNKTDKQKKDEDVYVGKQPILYTSLTFPPPHPPPRPPAGPLIGDLYGISRPSSWIVQCWPATEPVGHRVFPKREETPAGVITGHLRQLRMYAVGDVVWGSSTTTSAALTLLGGALRFGAYHYAPRCEDRVIAFRCLCWLNFGYEGGEGGSAGGGRLPPNLQGTQEK